MLNMIIQQVKKFIVSPYLYISLVSIVFLNFLRTGYLDPETGKAYGVFYLILHRSKFDLLNDELFSWQNILSLSHGEFFVYFAPCLLSLTNIHIVITERNTGYYLFENIRCKETIRRFSLFMTGTLFSGLINMSAYYLFAILVQLYFPDVSRFHLSPDLIRESFQYHLSKELLGAFIYGLVVSAIFLLIVNVCKEKNMCCSIGIFLFFLYDILIRTFVSEKGFIGLEKYRIDEPWNNVSFWLWIYIVSFVLYIFVLCRKRRNHDANSDRSI